LFSEGRGRGEVINGKTLVVVVIVLFIISIRASNIGPNHSILVKLKVISPRQRD
jgi:hypothetical protein